MLEEVGGAVCVPGVTDVDWSPALLPVQRTPAVSITVTSCTLHTTPCTHHTSTDGIFLIFMLEDSEARDYFKKLHGMPSEDLEVSCFPSALFSQLPSASV